MLRESGWSCGEDHINGRRAKPQRPISHTLSLLKISHLVYNVRRADHDCESSKGAISHLVDRVLQGEEVTLTRYGRPVAVLVRPDRLATGRATDALEVSAVRRVEDLPPTGASLQEDGRS